MDRRKFFKSSAMGVIGAATLGTTHSASAQDDAPPPPPPPPPAPATTWKIKEYRTLGRTGFKASDISSGYVKEAAILEKMLDAGVNYIDTAEAYGNEPVIGQVMKNRDRKKVFITSKLVIASNETKENIITRSLKCLERLQTDYLDCMMLHGCDTVAITSHAAFHDAMKQLKNEGKIRYLGISNHGSNWYTDTKEPMDKVLTAAALDGRFDVMLLAYNFIQEDKGDEVIKLCKEKNIGVTLMKVNPIGNISRVQARIDKMKQEGKEVSPELPMMITKLEAKAQKAQAFIQKYKLDNPTRLREAAIGYVLSNPDVTTVCCGFHSFDHLDYFLPLSGKRLDDLEKGSLAAYKEGCGNFYCRHACGLCESACPNHVPVNTIMRFNHYYEAQNREKFAMKQYAELKVNADTCQSCNGFCEKACPYNVPIHGLLCLSHQTLSFA